jgi:hypothetical protein
MFRKDGLHELRVGRHHLLVDVERDIAWVSSTFMEHERVLRASPEERKQMRHLAMFSMRLAPGWHIVMHGRFYPDEHADTLGTPEGFEQGHGYREDYLAREDRDVLVVLALLQDPDARVMPIEARPRNDPPRPRHPPYIPPQPLDPGGPIKLEDAFSYEVRLGDELGLPIDGVVLAVSGSPPIRTDADGRIRHDEGSSSHGLARFPDPRGLRKALRTRWAQIRDGDWLAETKHHTYIDGGAPLPMVKVRSDRLHTLVVQPRIVCRFSA